MNSLKARAVFEERGGGYPLSLHFSLFDCVQVENNSSIYRSIVFGYWFATLPLETGTAGFRGACLHKEREVSSCFSQMRVAGVSLWAKLNHVV